MFQFGRQRPHLLLPLNNSVNGHLSHYSGSSFEGKDYKTFFPPTATMKLKILKGYDPIQVIGNLIIPQKQFI